MLNFAYGSNMSWNQMRERCPSSRFVGIATLRDHKLAFTRRSVNRDCGVADVVAENGAQVWGVVYEFADLEIGKLDDSEGFRPGRDENSYHRRECLVFLDGEDQRPLSVFAYFGDPQPNLTLPNAAYKSLILAGERHWHLHEEYIRELEQIEVSG
jgi:gamma-glutamylcyclotransferase